MVIQLHCTINAHYSHCVCVCFNNTERIVHAPSRSQKVLCVCTLLSTHQLSLHKKVILIRWIPGRLICGSLPEHKQRISPGSAGFTYLESWRIHFWSWPEQSNNLLPSCSLSESVSQSPWVPAFVLISLSFILSRLVRFTCTVSHTHTHLKIHPTWSSYLALVTLCEGTFRPNTASFFTTTSNHVHNWQHVLNAYWWVKGYCWPLSFHLPLFFFPSLSHFFHIFFSIYL